MILLGRFLQRCGYVASSDFELNGPDFFKRSENSALFDRLIEIQKEIGIDIQKTNFSGRLSAKTRERLIDSVFEIDDILGEAYAQTNPMKHLNKAVMSPLKKIIFGIAFGLSGFLAFAGAIALASNHASRLEFYCGVCSFFRR